MPNPSKEITMKKLLLVLALMLLVAPLGAAGANPTGLGPREMRLALPTDGSAVRELCAPHEGWATLTLTQSSRPDPFVRVRQINVEGGSTPLGSFRAVGDQIEVGLLAEGACIDVKVKAKRAGSFTVLYGLDY